MELRKKFLIVALIYVTALVANLVLASWCIVVYFDSAFAEFETDLALGWDLEALRGLVRRQSMLLDSGGAPAEVSHAYAELEKQLKSGLARLEDSPVFPGSHWPLIREAAQAKEEAARNRIDALQAGASGPMLPRDSKAFVKLDETLGEVIRELNVQRQMNVVRTASTQSQVVLILLSSTILGAGLCWLGWRFMHHWVVQPVAKLREATWHIAQGDFDYRLPINSKDELGRLAGEVNHMCSTIRDMQRRLIEQERLAAAGEMFARLAHNIRNPLAGIRALAEATMQQRSESEEVVECQRRIIRTVDRFEKWLRDTQQSVSPLTLNLQPVAIAEPVESVAAALGPLFDRRGVSLNVQIEPDMPPVLIDSAHFEQGLAALVTNAVQASAPGQQIRIAASPAPSGEDKWQIVVEDAGSGIPPEIRDKIFLPCFTTKPDGNGLGLAMAHKIVKIHGGELTFESVPGQGTRFTATFPGLVRSRAEWPTSSSSTTKKT
ncbi:MAG TPA: HAMP domain-containing sensor histidine kinase [Phycisphaerae bacterium]|nr:HAMP domain-containing sensor histidine kinase [Phycisphaerae bacterium]